MKKVELLAPAGSKESMIAAINAGADAVYLAGNSFGARKYASNFTNEEIKEMIHYAHLRNVKVFVTVNTIIFENELQDLFQYTDFLVESYVDALIVQDIGVIEAFVLRYPNTEIHASTQMNAYNINQIKYLKSIGVKRVILARETSINDIRRIKQEVDIDLEVFVHGALCVSYSGNCLFSYMNGGRSGNRGECAQPCRLAYSLKRDNNIISDQAYLMSTKDLLTINELSILVDAGVASLKIEGRMKKPSYVVTTVKAYKNALGQEETNSFDFDNTVKELRTSFNREYTKGYILNEKPYDINNNIRPNHQGIEIGVVTKVNHGRVEMHLSDTLSVKDGIRFLGIKDIGGEVGRILLNGNKVPVAYKGDIVTVDFLGDIKVGSKVMKTQSQLLEEKSLDYLSENFKLVHLSGTMKVDIDMPLEVSINHPHLGLIQVQSEYVVQEANNKPVTEKQLYDTFNKFGNTHYYLEGFFIQMNSDVFIPNKVIKDLRRQVVSEIEKRIVKTKKSIVREVYNKVPIIHQTNEITIKVESKEQYEACMSYGYTNLFPTIKSGVSSKKIYSERIVRNYSTLSQYDDVIIQDYGALSLNSKLTANYNMNVTNSLSLYSLFKRNVTMITLSLESTFQNTNQIIKQFRRVYGQSPNLEVLLYGRIDLMISKYCPITKTTNTNKINCDLCENNQYSLVNQSNDEFPLVRDYGCNIRVLDSSIVNKLKEYHKYQNIGVNNFRIEFTTETAKEVKMVLRQLESIKKKT